MQVYALPMGRREVVESVGAVGKVSSWVRSQKQRYESQTVSRGRKYYEAEDSSCVQMENDSNSRVEVDIRTEETYMTYEAYICYMRVRKTRVAQMETGIEAEMYGHGGREDITENKS